MGKKSPNKYVRQGLRPGDIRACKAAGSVGGLTKEQLINDFKIKDYRINQMTNSKFLKYVEGKYKLDKKGEDEVRKHGMKYLYNGSTKTSRHDMALAQFYIDHPEYRDRWITESELGSTFREHPEYKDFQQTMKDAHSQGKYEATPDAAIRTEDGRIIAIEVVTSNYSEEVIEQKEAFADKFLDDIHFIRI